jgi:iron complex outermembrane recepter protein
MRMTVVTSRICWVIAGLCAGQNVLLAQATSEKSVSPDELQEVIVTAEKRSQNLQDVPASVSAISGETLQAMGAESFTDYARSIPGLTFTDAGAGRQTPAIRGINPSVGAAAVGYYIDETPIAGIEGVGGIVQPSLVDVSRIEVLRGPQGTLYGSSSIGGTIKLIPNEPNLSRFEGSVNGEALVTQGANGASPGLRTDLVLNVPILQDLAAVRAAFWYRDVGGFINRTWSNAGELGIATGSPVGTVGNLPDEQTWGLRAIALFQPNEQLKISGMIYVERQHFDGFTDITGGANNPNDQLVQSFISDTPEPQDNNIDLYNLTAKYSFGRFNLISSTSYVQRSQVTSEEGTSLIQLTPTFFGAPMTGPWQTQALLNSQLITSLRRRGWPPPKPSPDLTPSSGSFSRRPTTRVVTTISRPTTTHSWPIMIPLTPSMHLMAMCIPRGVPDTTIVNSPSSAN